ncbi:hypothetical protein [Candidatus Glomeribacter gigasporarum]|uniref:hypothetical protein n=1 Tax=Candidatus Glomeribacter gigasporarum TaxID=132144 RepID=UPI0013155DD1|nr:hypothetical protein [Candidatus Glomeribacter gigasporarum]
MDSTNTHEDAGCSGGVQPIATELVMMRMRTFIAAYAHSIDAWTLAHRCGAITLTAALALAAGWHFQPVSSAAQLSAQHTAIEALKARIRSAEQFTLPQRALNVSGQPAALPDDAGLLQMFAPALDVKNLKLDAFEPGESVQAPHWRERRVQLRLSGAFGALAECAARLATLPLPVAPVTAQLRTQANRRSLELTLRLIGTRAADPLPSEKTVRSAQASLPDPFLLAGASPQDAPGASLLFIGVLQRGRARAALVQSPAGIRLLHTGDVFEGLKVRRIDDAALFLSDGAAVQRTLALGAPDSARQKSPQPTLGTKP